MIQEHYSLQPFNTFGVNAMAAWFSVIDSRDRLLRLLRKQQQRSVFVLGGGSNLLLTQDLNQWVLHNRILEKSIVWENTNEVIIRVGGGENWHETVLWSLKQGYGGLENLSLIPGTVGAAPIQNIGAYGVELADVFERLEAIEISTGKNLEFTAAEADFGYRDSLFKRSLKGEVFITHVHLKLTRQHHSCNISYGAIQETLEGWEIDSPEPRDISRAVVHIRQQKLPDPAELGNSGSFFKNPVLDNSAFEELRNQYPRVPGYPQGDKHTKVPAGWLIEQAGWKGKRTGAAGTYHKQALVLVNHGGASGQEIWALAQRIISDVGQKFGITLQPEVNVL